MTQFKLPFIRTMTAKLPFVFIAVCLSLGLYHELRLSAFPRLEDGNDYGTLLFETADQSNPEVPQNWKARRVACDLSVAWFAVWGRPPQAAFSYPLQVNRMLQWYAPKQLFFCAMIASYHAAFYFITCLLLIAFLDNPIVPMLGTGLSVLFCSPAFFCPYLMPWDLPTMAAWTLIALLYLRKPKTLNQWLFLASTIMLCGLLKETVLVTALFMLSAPWKLWQRLAAIAVIVVASQILNWLICDAPPDWMFSIKGINVPNQPHWNPLYLWPVLLTNGGSLALLPWLLWKRRDWPLAATCGVFICLNAAGFMNTGYFDELRDWLELAPIGWVLIASYTKDRISISSRP